MYLTDTDTDPQTQASMLTPHGGYIQAAILFPPTPLSPRWREKEIEQREDGCGGRERERERERENPHTPGARDERTRDKDGSRDTLSTLISSGGAERILVC